jgi:hypothetical protein
MVPVFGIDRDLGSGAERDLIIGDVISDVEDGLCLEFSNTGAPYSDTAANASLPRSPSQFVSSQGCIFCRTFKPIRVIVADKSERCTGEIAQKGFREERNGALSFDLQFLPL